jgi:hypothetical protein
MSDYFASLVELESAVEVDVDGAPSPPPSWLELASEPELELSFEPSRDPSLALLADVDRDDDVDRSFLAQPEPL